MIITSDVIQRIVIAWMKSKVAITSTIPQGANEIREVQWHGADFTYPNIRVRVGPNAPILSPDCKTSSVDIYVEVNSNSPSSIEAETIAGNLIREMHNKRFIQSNTQFSTRLINQGKTSYIEGEGIWRSIVNIRAIVG